MENDGGFEGAGGEEKSAAELRKRITVFGYSLSSGVLSFRWRTKKLTGGHGAPRQPIIFVLKPNLQAATKSVIGMPLTDKGKVLMNQIGEASAVFPEIASVVLGLTE